MKNLLKILLLSIGLAGAAHSPAALLPGQVNDDTDLFLVKPSAAVGLPNVLIIWDNTANWGQNITGNTAYDLEKTALSTVISGLVSPDGTAKVNVGLALFTEAGTGNDNVRGSYIRYHLRPMDSVNSPVLSGLISGLHTIDDRGSNAQYGKAMHEAYQYFGGRPALAGAGQLKRDCAAFVQPSVPSLLGPLSKSFSLACLPNSTTYRSPIADGCQKNFIILISNGTTDSGENKEAQGLLTGLGGVLKTDPLTLVPNNEAANWSDEYARFLFNNDIHAMDGVQNAVVYTIAVYDKTEENNLKGPTPSQIALNKSIAKQGGGKFFAGTDLDSIKKALDEIFAEVQAVNSVFASVTLPVSVNPTTRGTNLNQVYMGLFRPDANLAPRWFGNLKLYQLARDSATQALFLADAQTPPQPAVGPNGFLRPTAISHWTTSSTFWGFRTGAANGAGGDSDSPDGDIVEKGSVAQVLRTTFATDQSARNLYTCIGCALGTDLAAAASTTAKFNDANASILQAALGAADATERTAIINWVRGQDNRINENDNKNADLTPNMTDARASIHGDVLHSRPAVVNYNRFGDDNDVYVFYGSNGDGVFRAVKGGMGVGAGVEQWGFVASEFFSQFRRLRENSPVISLSDANADGIIDKRPYFFDGPIGIYTSDADGNGQLNPGTADKVHLYIATRRGGRFIYALDVSDPVAPIFMWKKSNADIPELGYTWSEPKVVNMKDGTGSRTVIVMGLGYDLNQDNDPVVAADTMGRGIIVLDAFTGAVLWQAGPSPAAPASVTVGAMTHSIPSDVSALDRDLDGNVERLYVGDTGGNVWRVDINLDSSGNFDPAQWTVNQLAAVGGTGADQRKFLFPPDIVLSPDSSGGLYDAILIGSGDREHPFNTAVTNRFYMIKDFNLNALTTSLSLTAITETDLFDATSNSVQVGVDTATAKAALADAKGWKLTLSVGEKVISSAVTLGGATFFNTNVPTSQLSPGTCSNLGEAREYAVNYENAAAIIDYGTEGLTTSDRYVTNPAGGYLPSPVPGVVDNELFVLSGPSLRKPPSTPLGARYRTYWYMRAD